MTEQKTSALILQGDNSHLDVGAISDADKLDFIFQQAVAVSALLEQVPALLEQVGPVIENLGPVLATFGGGAKSTPMARILGGILG